MAREAVELNGVSGTSTFELRTHSTEQQDKKTKSHFFFFFAGRTIYSISSKFAE